MDYIQNTIKKIYQKKRIKFFPSNEEFDAYDTIRTKNDEHKNKKLKFFEKNEIYKQTQLKYLSQDKTENSKITKLIQIEKSHENTKTIENENYSFGIKYLTQIRNNKAENDVFKNLSISTKSPEIDVAEKDFLFEPEKYYNNVYKSIISNKKINKNNNINNLVDSIEKIKDSQKTNINNKNFNCTKTISTRNKASNPLIKYNIGYNRNFIFRFLILFNLIIQLFARMSKMLNQYEVKLKVKGVGEKNILGYETGGVCFIYRCPSYIYVNGNIRTPENCHFINIGENEENGEIKLVWTDSTITDTENMFIDCDDITEIDMRNFDFSQVTSTYLMFQHCTSLITVYFSNLNTQNLKKMTNMFNQCESLISIDLSNFILSQIEDMKWLFADCISLQYIKLGNFVEKSGIDTVDMFDKIAPNLVICLNKDTSPSIFNALPKDKCIEVSCDNDWKNLQKKIVVDSNDSNKCVTSCQSSNNKYEYKSYCLSSCYDGTHAFNFKCYPYSSNCNTKCKKCIDTGDIEIDSKELCTQCNDNYYPKIDDNSNIDTLINCYHNPEKYYLDSDFKYKPCYKSCKTCSQGGTDDKHNCQECDTDYELKIQYQGNYNCYPKCDNYYIFNNGNFECLNNKNCPYPNDKLIQERGQCIDDCSQDSLYTKIFRNKCYQYCPNDISYESEYNINFCEAKCSKENPLEKKNNQECTNFCGINEMEKGYCISKYHDDDTNGNLILNNILKDITTINFNRNSLNDNIDVKIEESYITFTITTTNIQKNSGFPLINLGECENKLKEFYQINNNNNFIIFTINIQQNDIYKLVYEVYSEINGNNILSKLDLNKCNDIIKNNEIAKCSTFSIESIKQDSCLSCAETYYPIYGHKDIFKCYQNLEGYYLDNNQHFKKCYESCETCETEGNQNTHNCIKCNKQNIYELIISPYLNCYEECIYYFYYDPKNNKYYCTPDSFCIDIFDKLIPEKKQCIDNCYLDSYYRFEFKKTCLYECPQNISKISENKTYFCEAVCTKEKPFEIISTQECTDFCPIFQFANKFCKINYKNNEYEGIESQEKLIENIQKELMTYFDTSVIDSGKDIIIELDNIVIEITSTENQKAKNISNNSIINLGLCEDKIKEEKKISKNDSLYILKVDIKQKEYKIPKIQYEIYYPFFNKSRLNKLNLTICENIKIDYFIPIIINETLDMINPKSGYFNDICYTFTSQNKTDVPLYQRKKEFIDKRLAVCEENCDFSYYYKILGKVVCSCQVKTNFNNNISANIIDLGKLWNSFIDKKYIEKLEILKCYKLIFSLKNYFQNYGNIFLLFIILLYFLCLIIFFCHDFKAMKEFIYLIIYFRNAKIKIEKIINNILKEEKEKYAKNIVTNKNITKNKIKVKMFNKKENNKNPKKNLFKHSFYKHKDNKHIYGFNKVLKTNNNSKIKSSENSSKKRKANTRKKFYLEIKYKNNKRIKFEENEIYEIYKKIYSKTNLEMNELSYTEALKYDKRSFCVYYYSLVTTKHLFFFSFLSKFDYNSRALKIYLFFFNFTTYFIVNTLFFNEKSMNKIYQEGGNFDFIYNIPQILYSTIISVFLNNILSILALSEKNFRKLRHNTNKNNVKFEAKNLKRKLKIKFTIFLLYNIIILFIYWFYLGCFCAVYKNTQIHIIKDTAISFGTSLITPFGIYLLPSIFRILSLRKKKREILFVISKILQLL